MCPGLIERTQTYESESPKHKEAGMSDCPLVMLMQLITIASCILPQALEKRREVESVFIRA